MPIFFFDRDDGTQDEDDEGTILPDLRAAQCQAIRIATDFAAEAASDTSPSIGPGRASVVCIRDGAGKVRSTVRFVYTVSMAIDTARCLSFRVAGARDGVQASRLPVRQLYALVVGNALAVVDVEEEGR